MKPYYSTKQSTVHWCGCPENRGFYIFYIAAKLMTAMVVAVGIALGAKE